VHLRRGWGRNTGTEVGILKEGDEVSFNGFLQSTDGGALESEVGLEVLSDLTDQALEGELSDEELSRLLVTTDLTESDGTRLVSVGLLHTSGRWGRLAGSLGSKLLTRSLATGGLRHSLPLIKRLLEVKVRRVGAKVRVHTVAK
jgi:hypothetical protein